METPAQKSVVGDTGTKVNSWGIPTQISFGNYMLGNFLKLHAGKFFGNYVLENFSETICWEIFRSYMLEKFFGNYMLGNFWDPYDGKPPDGNILMENSGGYQRLLDGGNYGTMLWYHTMV